MSQCRDIQPELSAYVDGELTPSQRAEVDAHVASCRSCQQELAELQTLAVGMAALPKLQPAPQFLAEVRRKIVRGDRPEPMTWHDYLFRPFWLKVPLEAAAVIAVAILVARFEKPPAPREQKAGPDQMANMQDSDSQRDDGIGNKAEPTAKTEPAQAPADQLASTASAAGSQNATAPQAEPPPAQDSMPSSSVRAEKHFLTEADKSGPSAPVVSGGAAGVETRRRVAMSPTLHGAGTPPPPPPNAAALAQNVGIDPAKLGGVIIVDGKSANDMRSQAEQLVARCNGIILTAPQSKDFTGQVFFVEIPQEYAATFKLEMSRLSHLSTTTDVVLARDESGMITGAAPVSVASTSAITGVLTGSRNSNAAVASPQRIAMENTLDSKTPATVVLEIVVVPPKK